MKYGPLDLTWVTAGGKALVAVKASEVWGEVILARGSGAEWIEFPMPHGGTAHFRVADITCINSHFVPKAHATHNGGIAA